MLVLHFQILKTKTLYTQNGYIDNFTSFFLQYFENIR